MRFSSLTDRVKGDAAIGAHHVKPVGEQAPLFRGEQVGTGRMANGVSRWMLDQQKPVADGAELPAPVQALLQRPRFAVRHPVEIEDVARFGHCL